MTHITLLNWAVSMNDMYKIIGIYRVEDNFLVETKCRSCGTPLNEDNCSIFFSDGSRCDDCCVDWDQVEDRQICDWAEDKGNSDLERSFSFTGR